MDFYQPPNPQVPLRRWQIFVSRPLWLPLVALAVFIAACGDAVTLPSAPKGVGRPANLMACTADPVEMRSLLVQGFAQATDGSFWLAKLDTVLAVGGADPGAAQQAAVALSDVILLRNRLNSLAISPTQVSSLVNQITCYAGLGATVSDPNNSWVIHVSDPVATFVTTDVKSGIQFPSNAVTQNTLVTATRVPTNSLLTLLDNYAIVYEFNLVPAQTLRPGTKATIAVCPDPAALARVPTSELNALLARLVLGHQQDAGGFEVLARVPLPPALAIECPADPPAGLHASWSQRLFNTFADALLPQRAYAALRGGFVGGVGGSTSEFSPFGPVDPQLYATGGVGGSTSEFVRTGPPTASFLTSGTPTIDGTVGTTRTGAGLPNVSVTTFLGTPIPGVSVSFGTGAPNGYSPVGNASVCGANTTTGADGVARVTCLYFGTTVQYQTAYTALTATFGLPTDLAGTDASGGPIVTITPPVQSWLLASYGPNALVFRQLPAPQSSVLPTSYTTSDLVKVRIEIQSALGEIVPLATNAVTITLNKNTFLDGSPSATTNAVQGVATFAKQIPTAATGYSFFASAALSNVGSPASAVSSATFEVRPSQTTQIAPPGSVPWLFFR